MGADQCMQRMLAQDIQSSATLGKIYSVECISMHCLGCCVVPIYPRDRRVLTIPECEDVVRLWSLMMTAKSFPKCA